MEGNPLRASRRTLEEPLLFIGDGLKGLPEAVKEVYPEADFQSCILHRVRSALHKVRKRDREALKEDLKRIYRQGNEEGFRKAFQEVKKKWGLLYPEVVKSWEREIPYLATYLRYPQELRPYIYTTNTLERFIKEVKRRSKVIEVFPDAQAAEKILYLVSLEMNERYRCKALPDFSMIKEELLSTRRIKYPETAKITELCDTQNY